MGPNAIHELVQISRLAAEAFAAGLWQGLALAGAVAVGLRLIFRGSAAVRFTVWAFSFALMIVVPLLPVGHAGAHPRASATIHLGAGWALAIAATWMVFTALRAARLLQQAAQLRCVWRRATPVAMDGTTLALLESGARLGRRLPELCTSVDADAPGVIGFFSPRLLIPERTFATLTAQELGHFVLHECEHLRRRDDWLNLLQKIALVLFPLHPALLWVDRRLSLERELACDARVATATAAPFDYARCLVRLAEQRTHCRRVALALSAWGRQSELAQRVQCLVRPARRVSPLYARVSIALLGLVIAAGAVEMARIPAMISFASGAVSASADTIAAGTPRAASALLPVVSRPETRVTLDRAVLRSRKPRVKHLRALQMRRVSALPTTPPFHAVLIGEDATAEPSRGPEHVRLVYVSDSFAAVPLGDGWLIVHM